MLLPDLDAIEHADERRERFEELRDRGIVYPGQRQALQKGEHIAPAECRVRLPPMDLELNEAAVQLTALLLDDCVRLLLEACGDDGVREAVRALLVALAKARPRRPR